MKIKNLRSTIFRAPISHILGENEPAYLAILIRGDAERDHEISESYRK